MAAKNLPSYVGEYRRWCAASPEEKPRLLRRHLDHTKLLPSIAALRDDPENVVMPNGRRLADCAAVELSEMADYFVAVRDTAWIRNRKIKHCDALTGIRI
jgi:hypothetical protein